mgnify:CR=1 FL=1
MIIGKLTNGKKCVYDVPEQIKSVEQFKSLIYGYNNNIRHREELKGQPLLLALNGPMYNGTAFLKSTGKEVTVIRYEIPTKY